MDELPCAASAILESNAWAAFEKIGRLAKKGTTPTELLVKGIITPELVAKSMTRKDCLNFLRALGTSFWFSGIFHSTNSLRELAANEIEKLIRR